MTTRRKASAAEPPRIICCPHCKRLVDGAAHVVDAQTILHPECVAKWDREKRGLKHECPQCRTRGKVPDRTRARKESREVEATEDDLLICGYNDCRGCRRCRERKVTREIEVVPDKPCPLCDGVGWLANEPKPVTKTEIVGWTKS